MVICEQENIDTEKIKAMVEHELEERGCHTKSKVDILASKAGQRTADIIVAHLMHETGDDYIDIVILGNQGADFSSNDKNKYLGTVANEVITKTKINCLFMC